MPTDDDITGSVSLVFQRMRAGDPHAVEHLWERFRPRLLALARNTLSGQSQRFADPEDALQSAFVSFWQRAERGDFGDDLDRDDLWNVLGVITVRKALKHQERERAQKRGGGRTADAMPVDAVASPHEGPELDIVCTEMLELLEPDLRPYAVLRLMGHKNREIADQFGCTERKVERKLQLIREIWEAEVQEWRR